MTKPANKLILIEESEDGPTADELFELLLDELALMTQAKIKVHRKSLNYLKAYRQYYKRIYKTIKAKVLGKDESFNLEITVPWLSKVLSKFESSNQNTVSRNQLDSAVSLLDKIESAYTTLLSKDPNAKITLKKIAIQLKDDNPQYTQGAHVRQKLHNDITKMKKQIFELLHKEIYVNEWNKLRTLQTFRNIKNLNKAT